MNVQSKSLALRWPMALMLAGFSMLLLPALTHSILDHPPEYDELLHILAARSFNETGIPSIADGLYSRTELYTRLVASVTGFTDKELVAARLPALLFGMLTTAMLTAWVSFRAGWIAAIATASVFAILPDTLNSVVQVRFYSLHTLIMGAILLFWFESSNWKVGLRNLLVFVIVSSLMLWLGLQFHELTQITIISGAAGLIMLLLFDQQERVQQTVVQHPVICVLSCLAMLCAIALAAIHFDVMTLMRGSVPLWSANKASNYAYYVSALSVQLPFIWPLFPLMLIGAFYEKPRLALFCLTAFLVALVINSIAAPKATRYFYHAYPMFCILWGVGFQRVFMYISKELQKRHQYSPFVVVSGMLFIMSLCFLSAHEVKRSIKLLLARGEPDQVIAVVHEPDWTKAIPLIGDLAQRVDTLIVSSGVKGLYVFGKFDYEMNTTVVQETDTGLDFGTDPRTNRQVIGQADSVEMVIDSEGQELFIIEDRMINKLYGSPKESVAVLNQRCEAIDLSITGSQLSAWLC